jgi:hypothetical protein
LFLCLFVCFFLINFGCGGLIDCHRQFYKSNPW